LVALLTDLSLQGPVGYVETDYFGGVGTQAAAAFSDGVPIVVVGAADISPVAQTLGAINAAMRALGVMRRKSRDEFDAVGLGQFRSLE